MRSVIGAVEREVTQRLELTLDPIQPRGVGRDVGQLDVFDLADTSQKTIITSLETSRPQPRSLPLNGPKFPAAALAGNLASVVASQQPGAPGPTSKTTGVPGSTVRLPSAMRVQ